MDRNPQQNLPDLDTKMLSDFIYELNIARRHMATYPTGHPMIDTSTDKIVDLLAHLFEFRPEIGFGVARDALMFEGEWLDRKNPVYRDFATFLFGRGIAAIHFSRLTNREELIRLNQLLRADRDQIQDNGGYPELLEAQFIQHISIIPVDYRSFSTTEESRISSETGDDDREPLWENFLHGLMEGVLDPDGSTTYMPSDFDPRLIAGILNRKAEGKGMTGKENYDAVISSFISKSSSSGAGVAGAGLTATTNAEDLGDLIQQLNPELRRQFLNSTFRTLENHEGKAQEVIEAFPSDLIVESLTQINKNELQVSGNILNLLGKLSKHQGSSVARSTIQGKSNFSEEETKERMRLIFREEDLGKFIPDAYQNALNTIVSTEQLTLVQDEEIDSLRAQLNSQSVERQTSAIIFELMDNNVETELESTLQRNLVDLGRYFLETGDFSAMKDLHQRWLDYLNREDMATFFLAEEVLDSLHSEEFINETLDSLERYGQEKQDEIREYILSVGAPFADELVNRLADTESMTIRRFYMNCLTDIGRNAHDAIFRNMSDSRWYLVRNLVIILSRMEDPSIMKRLYPIIDYPHPRVHQEVLKLMFTYIRPRAERQLMEELLSDNIQTQIYAVQLADRSQEKEVHRTLTKLLCQNALSEEILELKTQILRLFAKIANPTTVPILEKLLQSGNILHPKLFRRLKLEIVKTLGHYPAESVSKLLEKIAHSGSSTLATTAVEQLRLVRRKSS